MEMRDGLVKFLLGRFEQAEFHLRAYFPSISASGIARISPRLYAARRSSASFAHNASTAGSGASRLAMIVSQFALAESCQPE